jgi:hypothetical protein
MDRKQYNQCIAPYMRGSKPKEQRQFDMCVGAKICSGKAGTEEEARGICSLPKEPKPIKTGQIKRGQSCEKDVAKLAQCIVSKIDMNLASNINSIELAIMNALMECSCPK